MEVQMIYKRNSNNEESVFTAFTTNKLIADIFVEIYKDVFSVNTIMNDTEYKDLCDKHCGKEIQICKFNNTIGVVLIRRSDKVLFSMNRGSFYDCIK